MYIMYTRDFHLGREVGRSLFVGGKLDGFCIPWGRELYYYRGGGP